MPQEGCSSGGGKGVEVGLGRALWGLDQRQCRGPVRGVRAGKGLASLHVEFKHKAEAEAQTRA